MKRFTVPCSFKGVREKHPFHFYLGNMPNDAFHPLHFQKLWLQKRGGKFPVEVLRSVGKLRRYAQHYNVDFEELSVYAMSEANKQSADSKPVTPAVYRTFKKKTSVSLLKKHWEKNPSLKPEVIKHAVETVFNGKKASPCAKMLLSILFLQTKTPLLRRRLQQLDEQFMAVAKPPADNNYRDGFTYGIMVQADAHGCSLSRAMLEKLVRYSELPVSAQILALLECRNLLEIWAMNDAPIDGDAPIAMPYKLSDVHADLRGYFAPQQWRGKGRPSASGMANFAWKLFKGKDKPRSFLGYLEWIKKAADSGYAEAQYHLGVCFWHHGDYPAALHWMKKAAAQRYSYGYWGLGDAYLYGRAVTRNIPRALKYFTQAVEAGLKDVEGEIGICYLKLGGKANYIRAKQHFDKAALTKEPESFVLHNLADMYKHGRGVKKSISLAEAYYAKAKAAEEKYWEAQKVSAAREALPA